VLTRHIGHSRPVEQPSAQGADRGLRVVMTLLLSNEIDLVEAQLDYHLAHGVDFVIVTANRASPELLEKVEGYVERGIARLIRQEAEVFAQDVWVTRMARTAATEHGADWVINSDADEFFWPEAGTLKEILAAVPAEYGTLDVPVYHFVPPRDGGGFFADRLTIRQVRSLKPSGRALFAKAVHRATPDVEVSMGNHRVTGTGLTPLKGWEPIVGLHFPLRSYEQFEDRVASDLRADPALGMDRYGHRRELQASGHLREAYEQEALGPEALREGVRAGRLLVDERLKRFFEQHRDGTTPDRTGCDPERVEELRVEARRAVLEFERHPLYLQAHHQADKAERLAAKTQRLRGKAERLHGKLAASRAQVAAQRQRAEKAARRRDELKDDLAALRATWYVRWGSRVTALVTGRRRRPEGDVEAGALERHVEPPPTAE
jgi:hypothetical protein